MALVMITHDLGVIAETVDRVVVMYGGRVMEEGPVQQIFDAPAHSYTQQLLKSLTVGPEKSETIEPPSAAPALELRDLSKSIRSSGQVGSFRLSSITTPCAMSVSSCHATRSLGWSANPARARAPPA